MKIGIRRTGGIAGIEATLGPVETADLEAGAAIEDKVRQLGFFDLSAELPGGDPIPDGFSYAMTVEADERRHTVHYADHSDEDAARGLFEIQQQLVLSGCDFEWASTTARAGEEGDGFTWEAWYNRMPGSHDPALHVVGSCELESSSIELLLEPDNPGIFPQPGLLVLRLTIVRPEIGDDKMTQKFAIWTGDVGPNVKRVAVRGDATAKIPVIDVH